MEIVPLLDNVVLEKIESEDKTPSGILLPSSASEKPAIATVIAVGKGGLVNGYEVEMIVQKKDKVLYDNQAGTEINLDGKKYVILKQSDILAIIK